MNRSFLFDVMFAMATLVLAVVLFAVLAVATVDVTRAQGGPDDDAMGGQIRAELDGRSIQFPVLKTEVDADVSGDLANITVVQTFLNPASQPLNATYLFPLNKEAAVHGMTMRVGDEIVTAQIKKRDEARQTFETAKQQGKGAALLQQHRPNMFTQDVANLMPGQPVVITLRYVQPVARLDGAYELVVPLVVGPRYIPGGTPVSRSAVVRPVRQQDDREAGGPAGGLPDAEALVAGRGQGNGGWKLGPVPRYPEVLGLTVPDQVEAGRVTIKVRLASGMALSNVASPTHRIAIEGGETEKRIALAAGATIDNRDFVLSYRIAGEQVEAGTLVHRDKTGGTLAMLIEPPLVVAPELVTPREIVFVLDTSGSMRGVPMAASRAFMRQALRKLGPNDYFRIIRFSNDATEFSHAPVRATEQNIQMGLSYVAALRAGGGTEVMAGLAKAFAMAQAPETRRLVVFLSDGYVGNEADILSMVARHIGRARTYALGVGTSVNRYLLAEMAHHGRGTARFIDPTEKPEEAAARFADKLASTVMTDIEIDWGSLKVRDVVPAALPDLFAGDAIRVHARFEGRGEHTIRIKGRIAGRAAELPVRLSIPDKVDGDAGKAIPLSWARATIKDLMREIMIPERMRVSGLGTAAIEARVTELGLQHALVTQWTSFVAVTQRILNPEPLATPDIGVPLPMVKGVGPDAYGQVQKPGQRAAAPSMQHLSGMRFTDGFGQVFSGGATPEPGQLLGMLVALLVLLGFGRMFRGRAQR
jgi:Ca-activated chloride channel family protein